MPRSVAVCATYASMAFFMIWKLLRIRLSRRPAVMRRVRCAVEIVLGRRAFDYMIQWNLCIVATLIPSCLFVSIKTIETLYEWSNLLSHSFNLNSTVYFHLLSNTGFLDLLAFMARALAKLRSLIKNVSAIPDGWDHHATNVSVYFKIFQISMQWFYFRRAMERVSNAIVHQIHVQLEIGQSGSRYEDAFYTGQGRWQAGLC